MDRLADQSVVILLLLLLLVGGIVLDQTGQMESLQALVLDGLTPLANVLSSSVARVEHIIDTIRQLDRLQAENRALRAEVERLTIENVRLQEAAAENILLRQQLQFKRKNPGLTIRSADVIARSVARDPNNLVQYIIIDRGARDHIAKGMPVVTAQGLVGQVVAVGEQSARVLLLTDPSSSVNALVQRTRATGVVQGRLGANPVMRYIAQDEDVQVGDIVLTSGLGGNFPRGQVIGQVVSVHQRDVEMFKEAEIRPTVNFNRLEMVMIVTDFQPIPPGVE